MKRTIFFSTLSLLIFISHAFAQKKDLKVYSKTITSDLESYKINIAGTLQPENLELVIENTGDENIVNPRITINDKWNWSTIESIVQEIISTSVSVTDEEKAMAIWNFLLNNRYHWQPSGDDLHDPIIFLNVYGFAFCGHTAYIADALAKVAGLRSRNWSIGGHGVHEVFYNGKWHILDGQTGAFYLNRDNKTIAGIDEIAKDPWLVERTYHPIGDMWRMSHPRREQDISSTKYSREQLEKTIAGWYSTTENNRPHDAETENFHKMDLVLRPGEKIIFRWSNIGKWYNDFLYNEPPYYANGKIVYNPDYTSNNYRRGIEYEGNVKSISDDGFGPNLHVDSSVVEIRKYYRNRRDNDLGHVVYKVESPYVITGGKIGGEFYRNDNLGDVCRMLISFDGNSWIPVWTAKSTGLIENYQIIDDIISPVSEDPKYEYYVKAEFRAAGHGLDPPQESSDVTHAGLNTFAIETDFQVSPYSIPALSLGINKVKYTDDNKGNRKVRITQKWNENFGTHYPDSPGKPVYPGNDEIVRTSTPRLKWEKASDPDEHNKTIDFGRNEGPWTESPVTREFTEGDKITDYHIHISLRPDCRWPLSPNFDIDIRSDKSEFQVPEGWLLSGETYYWRVKAKDRQGNWGSYSEIWKFNTEF
ncbi:hypothetical protein ACFLU5_03495 [Bacteroidota bacterium]